MTDPLLDYINTHPDASPEELCAAFGIPFDRKMWDEVLARDPELIRRLERSPNPNDRRWIERLS